MPVAYVMVGLPGIGKSTFLADKIGTSFVYSTDSYIETLAASRGLTYSDVWSEETMKEATAWMNAEFDRAVKEGRNIVWDQTNLAAGKRRKILNRLPEKYQKICVLFHPPKTAEEWAEHRRRLDSRTGKTIPQEVIEGMMKTYVEPTLEEGFSEVFEIHMALQEKTSHGV